MKSFGTPRPWPPGPADELRRLFSKVQTSRLRDRVDEQPDLKIVLDELDAWLGDTRDYHQRQRKIEWQSLSDDLWGAAETRGPCLRAVSTSIDSLTASLHASIGKDVQARQSCLRQSAIARAALGTTEAEVASFDDLIAAVMSPQTSSIQVDERMQALGAVLQLGGRALGNIASQLAGIFDNCAWDVTIVRHELAGLDLPTDLPAHDEDAGLTLDERVDLARQLIAHPTPAGHHVIWFAFDNARFDPWRYEVGSVTFFDGPALLGCFQSMRRDPAAGRVPGLVAEGRPFGLPAELLHPQTGEYMREALRWPATKRWVAARVDLRQGQYADPVRVARDQVDSLVSLAAFHVGGTSWIPLDGHHHVVDESLHSGVEPFEPPTVDRHWLASDHTDDVLRELHDDLEPHLPVDDPALHELISAAAVLNTATTGDRSARLLQSVRIIELLATRCDVGWQSFLTDYLANRWAQAQVHHEIYRRVEDVASDLELREQHPELSDLRRRIASSDPSNAYRRITHRDAALDLLPELARKLPDHNPCSRRIRTVNHHTMSVAALAAWVDDLVADYARLVRRVLRCRNSLAHGGPANIDAVANAAQFISGQAAVGTSIALWGAYSSLRVKEALDDYRQRKTQWRDRIRIAGSVKEAAFEPVMK